MFDPIEEPMLKLRAALRVMVRRFSYFVWHRRPARQLFFLLLELAGVTLFAAGLLSTMFFFNAESPAEAAHRGRAQMPAECEAGFFNGGAYHCWYTIRDHPLLFLFSLAVLVAGAAIVVGASRHWFHSRRAGGA